MTELCGQRYEYDERICDFLRGHDDPDHHRSGDFHWLHYEETIDTEQDIVETWDEPIDRLNRPAEHGPIGTHSIHRVGLMNAPDEPHGANE